MLDDAIAARLPLPGQPVVVDPRSRGVALPLTGKGRPSGLGLLPRGSQAPVHGHVRFFVYWKQRRERTDLDLSVLLLDEALRTTGHVSYTNLKALGAVHSGDVTSAPRGASEFIELDLAIVQAAYVVPQVNVYDGERFDEAEEVFFGYMQRDPARRGEPFEPRTVQAKSDLYGTSRVSLPLVFARGDGGHWSAKWMHLGLRGSPRFNQVEGNRVSTSTLARGLVERDYLTLGFLERLLRDRGATVVEATVDRVAALDPAQPVTYLGVEPPATLPAGSVAFTPSTFWEVFT